jgi:hypothetical protein
VVLDYGDFRRLMMLLPDPEAALGGERAVASFCAAVLAGICLGNACSCHEILRAQRPGSGGGQLQWEVVFEHWAKRADVDFDFQLPIEPLQGVPVRRLSRRGATASTIHDSPPIKDKSPTYLLRLSISHPPTRRGDR